MASRVQKAFRITGYILLVLLVAAVAGCMALDRPLPEGVEGAKAEALTDKVLTFVNADAWAETNVVTFSYFNKHHIVWDKTRQYAEVKWGNVRVLLNLQTREGMVWKKDQPLSGEDAEGYLQSAWEYWCNDAFWFNPLVKLRDAGTKRQYVALEGPQDGLLVTYTSGGVTPGDSYLWYINPDGEPTHWRMWVNILPIGGIQTSWEGWKKLHTGALVSQRHANGLMSFGLANVRSADSVEDLLGNDIFAPLENQR